ncbi:MAG: M48 family metalloprotease [Planctomycetota bacterium]
MKPRIVIPLLLLAFLAGCITDPVTGSHRLGFDMSDEKEIAMGAQYAPSFKSQYEGAYPDREISEHCRKIVLGMAKTSHRSHLPWTFTILNSSEANAFALPGGTVCMTRGLLARLENEAQFACVMGHEIGHVSHRHSVKQQSDQALFNIFVNAAAIGIAVADVKYGSHLIDAGAMAGQLTLLSFSRGQESQADERGVEYGHQAGYDPREMAGVFRIFKQMKEEAGGGGGPAWMSTHPLDDDRIEHVAELVAEHHPEVVETNGKGLVVSTPTWGRLMARLREQQKVYDDYDKAARGLSKALKNNDRDALKRILDQIESCRKRLPAHALLVSGTGVVYYYLGDTKMAKRQLDMAIGMQEDLFEPRYFRAEMALAEGDASTALGHATVARRLWPHHPGPYFALGRAYDKKGDKANAILSYEGVLERANPKSNEYKRSQARLKELKGS